MLEEHFLFLILHLKILVTCIDGKTKKGSLENLCNEASLR